MAVTEANKDNKGDVARLRIALRKSTIRRLAKHRACVAGLGLRRIGDEVLLPDKPEIRGMVNRVRYLLDVEEVAPVQKPAKRAAAPKTVTKTTAAGAAKKKTSKGAVKTSAKAAPKKTAKATETGIDHATK